MADHKHWKRTLKRNTLNILLVVLVLALLAGVAAAVWTILPLFQRNHTEQPPQEEAEPTLEELLLRPDETIPDPEDAEPGELPVTGEQTKPQAPRHTFGGVAVYYEDGALTDTISQAHGIALTLPGGEALPRIDLQGISGSWGSLSDSERETLAAGVVQSYYVDGPARRAGGGKGRQRRGAGLSRDGAGDGRRPGGDGPGAIPPGGTDPVDCLAAGDHRGGGKRAAAIGL